MRRLARAVVDRAEALAEVIQIDMVTVPDSPALIADSALLAREADAFYDSLRIDTPPAIAARGFAPVDVVSDRIQRYVTTRSVSPRVASAWQAFASAEALAAPAVEPDHGSMPAVSDPGPRFQPRRSRA